MDQHVRDVQFMRTARCVASRSKCSSRHVGAVLVKDGSIVSEGYNGAPRGISLCQNPELPCLRRTMGFASGEGLEHCPAVHAEMNCLIQAARNGIATKGTTLYAYCSQPCKWCIGMTINAGVSRLVHLDGIEPYDDLGGVLLKESGIEVGMVDNAETQIWTASP